MKPALKSISFLLFFLSMTCYSVGQVTKFRSTSISFKSKNESTSQWTKWSELEETDVLITIDLEKSRIRIFSKEEQTYDIIEFFDMETDSDGDDIIKFKCVNEDGLKCVLRFMVLNSKKGRRQLYIDFSDVAWVYNIYKLD